MLPSKIFEDLCSFYESSGKDLQWPNNEPSRERVSVTIKDKYLVKQVVLQNEQNQTVYRNPKNDYLTNYSVTDKSFAQLKPSLSTKLPHPIKIGGMRSLSTMQVES